MKKSSHPKTDHPKLTDELQKFKSARVVFVGWNTRHAEILKKKVLEHVVEVAVKKKTDAAKAKANKATA